MAPVLRARQVCARLAPGHPTRCAVGARPGAVVHRATAPLGLLLLVPAPLAEVREEGGDFPPG